MKKVLLFFILILFSLQYKLHLLDQNKYPGSLCLDGSPTGLYYYEGKGEQKENLIIYMQGGGLCKGLTQEQILQSCYHRASTKLGSSKYWEEDINYGGILSNDPDENPNFYGWSKAYLPYCNLIQFLPGDGILHQGYNEGVKFQDKTLRFRGYNNTIQSFEFLQNEKSLDKMQKVLLSGESAGGNAAYNWANRLAEYLNDKTQVWTAPDSGVFLDLHILQYQPYINLAFRTPDIIEPKNCPYKDKIEERAKCIQAVYIAKYINTPLMMIQSAYDSWQLKNEYQLNCIKNHSFEHCGWLQMYLANVFQDYMVGNITKVTNEKPSIAAWVVGCPQHVFTDNNLFTNKNWTIPQKTNNTVNKVLYDWMNNQSTNQYTDFHYIQREQWPYNKPCSGLYDDQSLYHNMQRHQEKQYQYEEIY